MPEAPTATQTTRIQLCGRMSVEIAGAQIVDDLRGRQVRLLLAYLILNRDREVSREELSTALWPQTAPQSQDGALRTLLSRLRTAVGASVLTGREHLGLQLPEPVWVDFEAAETEISRAQTALGQGNLRAAWALAQVPLNVSGRGLLPGVDAHWLEPQRRELEELRLQALEVIGRAGLGLGGSQLASAERAARALIESEPYRESAYVLLMEALAQQGNVAEGLRVFESLRRLLRDELGTLPSPEALAVHDHLLNPQPRAGSRATDVIEPVGDSAGIGLPAELASRAQATLVGRVEEIGELQRLWESAASGRASQSNGVVPGAGTGRVVVLAGDAGVGKTRLTAELARQVHDRGAVVLAGRAPEESLVAYQPFLEALRHYVQGAALDELRAAAREYGAEIARLLPELRRRVPDLVLEPAGEPETERYRLFEAVVGLLSAIARRAPILLVLDDLHWADRATLLLLRHLSRAREPRRLLILVAYRTVETQPDGFPAMLADLHREQLLRELPIGGLSEAETSELVRVRTGETPQAPFVQALHRETEGNPLFIEEIVRHLREAGVSPGSAGPEDLRRVGLPEGVKQVIARRLSRLGPAATEWLRVAAVVGRDFDVSVLERVLDMPEHEFLDLLDEVLETGLVTEISGEEGRYSFSHALIRETLYDGMSAPRRARTHRRVGAALEQEPGEAPLAALALHFTRAAGAQDAPKAIAYAEAAGRRALEVPAYDEAAGHFARALETVERYTPEDEDRRLELLLLHGEAQVRAGDPARAGGLREAAEIALRRGDRVAIGRVTAAVSRRYIEQPGDLDPPLIHLLERALEITEGEQTALRVLLLARLCQALYFSPDRERMAELSAEATEIADALGDPEPRVYAAAARRRALWDPAHLDARLRASTQMLVGARAIGNLEYQLQAHVWLVVDLLEQGEREAVEAQVEAFSAGAERLRQPVYSWHAIVWRSMLALMSGRLGEAETLSAEAVAVGAAVETVAAPQYYAVQSLAIRREQGRILELADPARAYVAANPDRAAWRAALAFLLLEAGKREEAQEMLDAVAAHDFEDVPRDADWLTAMTILTDVAVGLGDARRGERLHELLTPYARQNVVIGLGVVCLGACSRYLGRLAATTGRPAEAREHFEYALEANRRLGATVEHAHTQLDLAILLGSGRRARELAQSAAATAERCELPWLATRAAALDRL